MVDYFMVFGFDGQDLLVVALRILLTWLEVLNESLQVAQLLNHSHLEFTLCTHKNTQTYNTSR